jgi:hypothetical protein
MTRLAVLAAMLLAGCSKPVAAANDPLGECIADCHRRGAQTATFSATPYPGPGIPAYLCSCTFNVVFGDRR